VAPANYPQSLALFLAVRGPSITLVPMWNSGGGHRVSAPALSTYAPAVFRIPNRHVGDVNRGVDESAWPRGLSQACGAGQISVWVRQFTGS